MTEKAVIDTNVLVSALLSHNPESPTVRIFHAIVDGRVLVLLSPEIIAEYEEVLHRGKFDFAREKVDAIIDFIKRRGLNTSPVEPGAGEFPDPDDKVFYCVALAAQDGGAFLVTGNARHYPPAPFVISPNDFAAMLDRA